MAWRQIGDKPLHVSEPMQTQLTDVYMRHWGGGDEWKLLNTATLFKADSKNDIVPFVWHGTSIALKFIIIRLLSLWQDIIETMRHEHHWPNELERRC